MVKIINIKVLRGPNYWSNYRRKIIDMLVDLGPFEELPTNQLTNFDHNLAKLMPSLHDHYCSDDKPGGFLARVKTGTWLGHVIEHIALELQWLAGMHCGYGRTRSGYEKGVYHVVFSYQIENAGLYAGQTAVAIVNALASHKKYLTLDEDLANLREIYDEERLGPSTESIIKEIEHRKIPWQQLDKNGLIMLGFGCNQKMLDATLSNFTSVIGVDIAGNKPLTKRLLESSFVPVPQGLTITESNQLDFAINELQFPLVIKPINGNHGRAVTTHITNKKQALHAFQLAKEISSEIVVEKLMQGNDYRFLVINFKCIAVALRNPAQIVGDGHSTIQKLIDKINQEPLRGEGHSDFLTTITIDKATQQILSKNKLSLKSILPKDEILTLKYTANISAGGTAIDVTDEVHASNILLAERIARLINLDICGIDVVMDDVKKPLTTNNGGVLEVNAAPGLRMHVAPIKGKKRNVAKYIIDMLYPEGTSPRIPIVAVTGTNGKTTTVRLIAHMAKLAGYTVGYVTTEGININNQEICQGDCSGPLSASVVLRDPAINFAVFECARGGILRAGLGFDHCSTSVVTNVGEDHLGLDDIHTIEDMARVKEVVPRSTLEEGYAILNADDDLIYQMKPALKCHVALFSRFHDNPHVLAHCAAGGLAVYCAGDYIVMQRDNFKTNVIKIHEIPLTFSGSATSQIQNVLSSILVGIVNHFLLTDIYNALISFYPSWQDTPGRMNYFDFGTFKVLIDYAHNEAAFKELHNYLQTVTERYQKKIGIIGATGDRRPMDIKKVGFYAAHMFDEIIIRHDEDNRGKSNEMLTELLIAGINKHTEKKPWRIISHELNAIQHAIDHAPQGSLIVYFPDKVLSAVAYVKAIHDEWQLREASKMKRPELYET